MKIMTLTTLLFVFFIYTPSQAATYVVQAKGMMCESCVQSVTEGFMRIEGVNGVKVDLINQTITVESENPIEADIATTILSDRGYEFIEIQTMNDISSPNE